MQDRHQYQTTIEWTGNTGAGTSHYSGYERSYRINEENKPEILGSADPAFLGDKHKYNPEGLLVAALSSCHMLWYLHLCSGAGIIVTAYKDNATGVMVETSNGGGQFIEVTLHPSVTVKESNMIDKAIELHKKANELCFIANSVNFPVRHHPKVAVK
ncbi:OsmC family protein [Parapedobacter soli]|uniref:OsmC family protein n=1 Tax=Parapedobacter soli TaxID=416955 RepID=UPI0021CA2A71|nr:OsmC family protein [Parapedobacter soli]